MASSLSKAANSSDAGPDVAQASGCGIETRVDVREGRAIRGTSTQMSTRHAASVRHNLPRPLQGSLGNAVQQAGELHGQQFMKDSKQPTMPIVLFA
jgi:hypothetical protein